MSVTKKSSLMIEPEAQSILLDLAQKKRKPASVVQVLKVSSERVALWVVLIIAGLIAWFLLILSWYASLAFVVLFLAGLFVWFTKTQKSRKRQRDYRRVRKNFFHPKKAELHFTPSEKCNFFVVNGKQFCSAQKNIQEYKVKILYRVCTDVYPSGYVLWLQGEEHDFFVRVLHAENSIEAKPSFGKIAFNLLGRDPETPLACLSFVGDGSKKGADATLSGLRQFLAVG